MYNQFGINLKEWDVLISFFWCYLFKILCNELCCVGLLVRASAYVAWLIFCWDKNNSHFLHFSLLFRWQQQLSKNIEELSVQLNHQQAQAFISFTPSLVSLSPFFLSCLLVQCKIITHSLNQNHICRQLFEAYANWARL